jgi:hypothetical protein
VTVAAATTPATTPTPLFSPVAVVKPATPKPVVHKAVVKLVVRAPRSWPVVTYRKSVVKPKPKHFICYIGQPCNPPPQYWTLTIGCTGAWRAALHRTTCPPGQPVLP